LKTHETRAELAPASMEAWRNFRRTAFQDGALPENTKQLVAIAVAHVTQCPSCIRSHTEQALNKGATQQEIMQAIGVASEMRAGAAVAHAALAIDEMGDDK